MAMQYKTIFYGGKTGISVAKADIASIATEVGSYLQTNGMQAQGIKLPGLGDAQKLVTKAAAELKKALSSSNIKDLGFTPDLKIIGGIDTKGDLSATVTGLLPPAKPGKPPVNYDQTVVIRKEWAKLETELKSEKNVVVNMTKQNWHIIEPAVTKLVEKHNGDMDLLKADKAFQALLKTYKDGDDVINKAAANQAKKFKTTEQTTDQADFGEMTTGTVVLAAHGSRADLPSGKTLGIALGKKTPDQIVELLTGNKDKAKNLSKAFKGTVLLSGCFTAAGGIAPEGDYNYDTFAGKVWALLKTKGINCKVSGMPGQARTNAEGDKSSVKPTEQKEYDRLKKEFGELVKAIDKLKPQLTSKDPKVLEVVNKKIKEMNEKLKTVNAEKEAKVMKQLIMNYGLDPVR